MIFLLKILASPKNERPILPIGLLTFGPGSSSKAGRKLFHELSITGEPVPVRNQVN